MEHISHEVLVRKLRDYRVAFQVTAVAETWCIAVALISIFNLFSATFAVIWLIWRWSHLPSDSEIAARVETRHPELRHQLMAAVELMNSLDPVAIKGSRDLVAVTISETEHRIATIPFHRLHSLNLLAALITLTIITNVCVLILKSRDPATPIPSLTPTPGKPKPTAVIIPSETEKLDRIRQLNDSLGMLPDDLLRSLPPHARTLDEATRQTVQAQSARHDGQLSEAYSLEQAVAETLSEFSRLADGIPSLQELAKLARELARDFGHNTDTQTISISAPPPFTGSHPTQSAHLAALPKSIEISSHPWMTPIEKQRDTAPSVMEHYSTPYAPLMVKHMQQLAEP